MWKVLKRQWKYLTAKLSGRLEERADPAVQLEQAINEAQEQHRILVEQAANVIARQKQTELQLSRAMDDLEKINQSTRQALVLAQQAQAKGDTAKAADYNQAAEGFANQLIATESRIEDLKTMSLQTAQASEQAKTAVQQNSARLQQQLAERHKLLNQLEQAKMQEQLNAATNELSRTVGADVPTLDQVRDKIEARYAKAIGGAELGNSSVEARMLEVQQAALGSQAQSRLDQLREQMGLPSGDEPGAVGAGASEELGAGSPPAASQAAPGSAVPEGDTSA